MMARCRRFAAVASRKCDSLYSGRRRYGSSLRQSLSRIDTAPTERLAREGALISTTIMACHDTPTASARVPQCHVTICAADGGAGAMAVSRCLAGTASHRRGD